MPAGFTWELRTREAYHRTEFKSKCYGLWLGMDQGKSVGVGGRKKTSQEKSQFWLGNKSQGIRSHGIRIT